MMARNQSKWDPYQDRRVSESKIYKESQMMMQANTRRYLLCPKWFNSWMSFLYGQQDVCPGRIDNQELVARLKSEGIDMMVKSVDYFEFPQATWKSLLSIYSGGPGIYIKFNGKIEFEQYDQEYSSMNEKLLQFEHVHVQFLNNLPNLTSKQQKESQPDSLLATKMLQVTNNSGAIRRFPQYEQDNGYRRKIKYVISSSTQQDETLITQDTQNINPLKFKAIFNNPSSVFGRSTHSVALNYDQNRLPKGLIGLENQGNNCYMNATLQCLMAITPFSDQLFLTSTKSPFTTALRKIFQSPTGNVILPAHLQKLVHKRFQSILQHDAHEFFIFLMTQLSDELQQRRVDALLENVESSNIDLRFETEERWQEYKQRNHSIVDHLFTGLFRSKVTCELCSLHSTTYDPFMVLSLPILKDTDSVQKCLSNFFQDERLQFYFCQGCKQDTPQATLQVSIAHAPEILVIHLKRFQTTTAQNNLQMAANKIKGYVSYERFIQINGQRYELQGVVVHWGTMAFGHYIAVVKRTKDKWIYCNDSQISECDEKIAMGQEAYMLFYQLSQP